MALAVTLTASTIGAKGISILFKDETGDYDAVDNPTGYGDVNQLDSPATTQLAYLIWKYWGSDTWSDLLTLTPTQISELLNDGFTATPVIVGISTDEDEVFSDGVHQVKYLPAMEVLNLDDDTPSTADFTLGSKVVVIANTSTSRIEDLFSAGALGWVIVNDIAYEIDQSVTQTSSQITLVEEFAEATVTVDLVIAADGDEKAFINKAAEACIVTSIGKLADRAESCRTVEMEINKLIRWQFAAQVQFDCEDYEGAHNLVLAIGKICQSGKCICNL